MAVKSLTTTFQRITQNLFPETVGFVVVTIQVSALNRVIAGGPSTHICDETDV
jgi:hypothetical protein